MSSQVAVPLEVPYLSSLAMTYESVTSTTVSFVNDGKSIVIIRNESGSDGNVAVHTVANEYGRTATATVSIANGTERVFAPTLPSVFNQRTGSDIGKTAIAMAYTTGWKVRILSLKI